ncbi:MAG: nucleotide exchange factor GrpE [Myxococcales bacterium]
MSDEMKAGSGVEVVQGNAEQAAAAPAAPQAPVADAAPAQPPPPEAAAASVAPLAETAAAPAPAAGPVPAEPAKRKAAPVVLAAVPDADAQGEIKKLREQLLEARQALRQREAELEVSQQMSRDTLAKLKDQHERTLRAVADLDNHKKRVVREREETAKFGQEKLLKDFLPVLDNFDRAFDHARSATDLEAVKAGLSMMRKLFEDTLSRHGVKGFSAMGQPFDPKLHEAIQTVESDQPAGTVVVEVVRGFLLHDRLMRPSMVGVAKPKAEQPKAAAEPPQEDSGAASPAAEPEKPA